MIGEDLYTFYSASLGIKGVYILAGIGIFTAIFLAYKLREKIYAFLSLFLRLPEFLKSLSRTLTSKFKRVSFQWPRFKIKEKFVKSYLNRFQREETKFSSAPTIFKSQALPLPEEMKKEEASNKAEVEPSAHSVQKPTAPIEASNHSDFSSKREAYGSLNLLGTLEGKPGRRAIESPNDAYFNDLIEKLEEKLQEFKIDCQVINVLKGPVVDTFEVELGPGVKVSKINSITEDLSLALCGIPIRIVYPMRGRTTVGIEVPRNPREMIFLDEVLGNKHFKRSDKRLALAFGKNAFGDTFVVDLAEMPHMLVAGATGAGKSVFINTLLVSLLVKNSPADLRLILIDPKQLELALYQDLPHLLMPVVTDAKRASLSLLWACEEMERRYALMKDLGVRNLQGFNDKVGSLSNDEKDKIRKYYPAGKKDLHLPFIVIIIDEFADLILTPKAGKEVEANVCRLAAKARAAGIHLVVATQRPSVDVITGLIKNNFPTRVSFRVTSPMDSRTILNCMGAEKLLGKGDMLYKHGIEMSRVHGAYIDEMEIESLMQKMGGLPPEFDESAQNFIEEHLSEFEGGDSAGGSFGDLREEDDEYFREAVNLVTESRSASASMLQRRLKIGYNRAANLVEVMEMRGIVGPAQGSKPREVLVSHEK